MKLITSLVAIAFLLLIPFKALATDWIYPFVVWDGYIYQVTEESVSEVRKEIGHVTVSSEMQAYPGNFSNEFSVGTKYFSIKNISTEAAIAVELDNGIYVKALREGEYQVGKDQAGMPFNSHSIGIATLLAAVLLTSLLISIRSLKSVE